MHRLTEVEEKIGEILIPYNDIIKLFEYFLHQSWNSFFFLTLVLLNRHMEYKIEKLSFTEQKIQTHQPKLMSYVVKLTILYSEVELMHITSETELDERIKALGQAPSVIPKKPLQELFSAMKRRIEINNQRDQFSANTLAQRNQSGIHFVGLNHYRNTLKFLEEQCRSEMKSSALPYSRK